MLYIYCGTATEAVRTAAHQRIALLKEADPGAVLGSIDPVNYEVGQLQALAGSVALFGGVGVYLIDRPSENVVCWEELRRDAADLAHSAHHFVVIEGVLTAADKRMLTEEAVLLEEYKGEAAKRVDTFVLCDALARKDKRSLWMHLQEVVAAGVSAEEVVGVLWWQLKMLRLAAATKSASEAGVKDFPYNKAKRALVNFKTGELEVLALSLLALYHDGHAGKRDIDLALEEWVLRV